MPGVHSHQLQKPVIKVNTKGKKNRVNDGSYHSSFAGFTLYM